MSEATRVGISGAGGRLAGAVAEAVGGVEDMRLTGAFNPRRGGEVFAGLSVTDNPGDLDCDVVVEATEAGVVMGNLAAWRERELAVVVGTSGFTQARLAELVALWGEGGPGCLVVPNFSVGAVLMMYLAEMVAPHFAQAEVVERHHADKPDAPSGTALSTAARLAAAGGRSADKSIEVVDGARGAEVEGVRVHSLRLAGILSHQEVSFSNAGEVFSIVHQSTAYGSFGPGAVMAIRHVLEQSGVSVGLDAALGL